MNKFYVFKLSVKLMMFFTRIIFLITTSIFVSGLWHNYSYFLLYSNSYFSSTKHVPKRQGHEIARKSDKSFPTSFIKFSLEKKNTFRQIVRKILIFLKKKKKEKIVASIAIFINAITLLVFRPVKNIIVLHTHIHFFSIVYSELLRYIFIKLCKKKKRNWQWSMDNSCFPHLSLSKRTKIRNK